MILNAFTHIGPYVVLILCGIKRTENRSAWPVSTNGRVVRINHADITSKDR